MPRAIILSRLLSPVQISCLANFSPNYVRTVHRHSLKFSHCSYYCLPRWTSTCSVSYANNSVNSLAFQAYFCPTRSACTSSFNMSQQGAGNVSEALRDHGVVPDVIASAPSNLVQVSYSSGVSVVPGNELTPTQVKSQPQISWPHSSDPSAMYTVVLTDPDAPSRSKPEFGQWRHWLVTNIPSSGDVSAGEVVSDYVGSGPPKDTGLHRYVFLVYKQSDRITAAPELFASKHKASGREKWNVAKFASDHKLGEPIAANFYQAKYDDYVPDLYAQFTEK